MTISVDFWNLITTEIRCYHCLYRSRLVVHPCQAHRPLRWHIERLRTLDLLDLYVVRKLSEAAGSSSTAI